MTLDASKITDRKLLMAALPKGGVGAEIGVQAGEFAKDILEFAQPSLLLLIDCWQEQPVSVVGSDPSCNSQQSLDECLLRVRTRFNDDKRVQIIRAFSVEAAALFPDEFFDWIYIDANHLRCYADMAAWLPKVRSGGYMMGHDYQDYGDFITVKTDADRFARDRNLELVPTVVGYDCASWVIRKP